MKWKKLNQPSYGINLYETKIILINLSRRTCGILHMIYAGYQTDLHVLRFSILQMMDILVLELIILFDNINLDQKIHPEAALSKNLYRHKIQLYLVCGLVRLLPLCPAFLVNCLLYPDRFYYLYVFKSIHARTQN